MRIAVINSIRVCGGGEKWLVRQAGCWRDRGHEPLIVCQPGSGLERLAADAGLVVAPVRMPHDISLPAVMKLAATLRASVPEVVMFCNARAFRLGLPASRLAGKPPALYRNGLTATFKNRTINRTLFGWAERMVVISEPLREEMASYRWIPPERLQIIRNGIDTAAYAPDPSSRERVRAEVGTPRLAVVAAVLARVTEDKGQVETIQALAQLVPRHPSAELWIVGEGTLQPRLEQLAAELGVADRVRFLGFRTDIPAVLQAVDIVVQASHREGLGNTLLEAMAAARPVLASAVGGIVDVVLPGETGELVPPRDPAAIARSLGGLFSDAEKRRVYGENGRRRVDREFRLERETEEWCRLFAHLARARGCTSGDAAVGDARGPVK